MSAWRYFKGDGFSSTSFFMLKNQTMRKALLLFTLILFTANIYSQDLKTNKDGFTTIGYFSDKNLIAISGKVLKLENYTFLQIILDDELYNSDYEPNDVRFSIDLGENQIVSEYVYLNPISNETNDSTVHLILLNDNEIEIMKQNNIFGIEVTLGFTTKYRFKNIKEPNFFKNNLK